MGRLNAAACGTAFLVAAFGALPAGNPPLNAPDQTNKQPASQQRGTKDAPIFVQGIVTTQPSEQQTQWEKEESTEKAANEQRSLTLAEANLLFTGLLFAAAVGQIALFWWQLRLISSSAMEAKAAAKAAQTSADAAKAQAEALAIAQRAWVFFTRVDSGPFTDGNVDGKQIASGMWFVIQWVNAGNTPALHTNLFRVGMLIEKGAQVPVFTPDSPVDHNSPESRSATLAQHLTFGTNLFALSDDDVERLKKREARFFLFGRATYMDMFHSDRIRVTEVCLNVEFDGDLILPNGERQARISYTPVGPQNTAT